MSKFIEVRQGELSRYDNIVLVPREEIRRVKTAYNLELNVLTIDFQTGRGETFTEIFKEPVAFMERLNEVEILLRAKAQGARHDTKERYTNAESGD